MAVDRIGDGFALRSKGDIVSHDGTANIAVSPGTNGQVLTSITSTASGLGWSNYTAPTRDFEGISYSTLTATTDSITISGIPTTYGSLIAYIFTQGTTNGGNSADGGAIYVQVNGNTTTATYGPNIYRYTISAFDVSQTHVASGGGVAAESYGYIGSIGFANGNNSSTSVGRYFSGYELEITDYANTTNFKTYRSTGGHDSQNLSTSFGGYYAYSRCQSSAGTFRTTSAITSIRFFIPTAGKSFNVGTWIALFGVKK
jgi:hypothetical protein